jgi:hypothetical protein
MSRMTTKKGEIFLIYDKVIKYCNDNNLTVMAFEQKCGLSNGLVEKWNAHGFVPKIETVKKISVATGIPIQNWLE